MKPPVEVLLVNWNGWQHTVECLESLFRQVYEPFAVVVCDNGSRDGSWERLAAWAKGELVFPGPGNAALGHLFATPLRKPIPYRWYERGEAEAGGRPGHQPVPLTLIQTGANLGFGGGNNVGLRYILARGEARYVWLLNNDTVVEPDALARLVARAEADPRTGAVGSKLLYYQQPDTIASLCGKQIHPWLAVVHSPYMGAPEARAPAGEPPLDYLEGASCLLSVAALRRVGLFDTRLFHFWEDVDLCRRLVKAGYRLACEPQSRVYHKEKVSLEGASPQADYHEFLSGLVYYRKHCPSWRLWTVQTVKFLAKAINRLRRRQFDRVPLLVRAFRDGLRQTLS